MENIIAKYSKTLYESGDFLIGTYLKLEKHKKKGTFIKVKGYNLPKNQCFYHLFGDYEDSKKYGKTFVVERFELTKLKSVNSVKAFFDNEEFSGQGRAIKKLIKHFKENSVDVLSDEPDKLREILTDEQIEALRTALAKVNSLQLLMKKLTPMGVTFPQIKKINNIFREDAIEVIDTNPFELMDIKGIGFKTCDTIARHNGTALDNLERIKGGVIETLNENAVSGNTYILDEDLIAKAMVKLNDGLKEAIVTRKKTIDAISLLLVEQKMRNIKKKMFSKNFFDAEQFIATTVKIMVKRKSTKVEQLLKEIDKYNVISLSEGQKNAVKNSLSNELSIITGGAGTGKTTVMRAIIAAYEKVFPHKSVTLLAPTGKASRRMSEVTGIEASTIHHALGLVADEQDVPFSEIEEGLVVVDEFSMVDTLLFAKLLTAVSHGCKVILMGDPNQLPSVAAGACLKDLIDSKQVPVSKLTEIFRQDGGVIVDNSLKAIKKDTTFEYNPDMLFVSVQNDEQAAEQIKVIYNYYARENGIENVALITPLRRQNKDLLCVADVLNGIIQKVVNQSDKSFTIGETEYRLNDRVMMWKNTPIASNGDVGTIVSIDTENEDWGLEIKIDWENGQSGLYHKKDFNDITLAYAMSVHKSQGSEYDVVIMPVLMQHKCRLFKNNLLYTAITRAKKRVVLVGNKSALNIMIENSETNERLTYLKEFLIEA